MSRKPARLVHCETQFVAVGAGLPRPLRISKISFGRARLAHTTAAKMTRMTWSESVTAVEGCDAYSDVLQM